MPSFKALSVRVSAATLLLASCTASAVAADRVSVGFISTLSGVNAPVGQDMLDGFNLWLAQTSNKLGGLPVTLSVRDDESKPDVARQVAKRFVENDKVDVVTGVLASNIMLSIAKPLFESKTFMLSMSAGPSVLAGKGCNPYFFAMSWQNDNLAEALGQYFTEASMKRVFVLSPDFPAGRDMVAGLKRTYSTPLLSETYTQFLQMDYASELTKIRAMKPDSLFFFLTAGPAINFINQYAQSGLTKDVPAYATLLDQTIFAAVGRSVHGTHTATNWLPGLKNAANEKFVEAFKKAYNREPSPYAANAYDTARLLDSAIAKIGGKIEDKAAFRKVLEEAPFESVRGSFKFNKNHFPIQNFYVGEAVDDGRGGTTIVERKRALTDWHDAYVNQCTMAEK